MVRLPAGDIQTTPGSDRVTVTGIDHDGLVNIVPVAASGQLDADEIALGVSLPDGPVCLLVHEESRGLSDLRQLRLEGELVSGRLFVRKRSGSLAPSRWSAITQIWGLGALGRAAKANRARIEAWKGELVTDRISHRRRRQRHCGAGQPW